MKQWFVKPCSPARRVYGRNESRPYAKIMKTSILDTYGFSRGKKKWPPAGGNPLRGAVLHGNGQTQGC